MDNDRQQSARLEGLKPEEKRRISDSTIHRLSLYHRLLGELEADGTKTVSSKQLAELQRLTPAQVRKDLSFFGAFGTRGLGYPVNDLRKKIAGMIHCAPAPHCPVQSTPGAGAGSSESHSTVLIVRHRLKTREGSRSPQGRGFHPSTNDTPDDSTPDCPWCAAEFPGKF